MSEVEIPYSLSSLYYQPHTALSKKKIRPDSKPVPETRNHQSGGINKSLLMPLLILLQFLRISEV